MSRITDKILPAAKEWQQRLLESVYAVVFLDAIHYHVRSEGQVVKKTDAGYTHWTLLYNNKYYDPEFGLIESEYTHGKITSFLEVYAE